MGPRSARLWIDTDVGTNVDDALALLAAVAHPGVELVGVSTVGGQPGRRATEARHLLDSAGALGTPVLAAPTGSDLGAALAGTGAERVLAIGPLTNLARLMDPSGAPVPPWPVTVMGGALGPVWHRGAWRTVESNFGGDPAAARRVVGGWPAVTLVSLDVTVAARLTPSGVARLVRARPLLAPLVERWLADQRRAGVEPGDVAVVAHDPSALLVAAGEPVARFEARQLEVEDDGGVRRSAEGLLREVVVELDGAAVCRRLLALLDPSGATLDG